MQMTRIWFASYSLKEKSLHKKQWYTATELPTVVSAQAVMQPIS